MDNLQRMFQRERKWSLDYLQDITYYEGTGHVIGWEKVDPLIRNSVILLHQNPHLYHYGESCSGHIWDADIDWKGDDLVVKRETSISTGYMGIGSDASEEAIQIVTEVEELTRQFSNVETQQYSHPAYQAGEVRAHLPVLFLRVGPEFSPIPGTLEEQYRTHIGFWAALEKKLFERCGHYPPIQDLREIERTRAGHPAREKTTSSKWILETMISRSYSTLP